MRRLVPAACLVGLLLLSGCLGLGGGVGDTELAEPASNRPDPETDVLGWEDGYWWNDSVPVDAEDGLSEAEIEAVTARAMARIERIRGHEFREPVSVEVVSRETYRERRGTGGASPEWREQFWEALFVVDQETTVDEAFGELYGTSVLGYYSGGNIVVVSDGSEQLRLSRGTLVHELEHALQDQQFGLGSPTETRDARLAQMGIIEGDANYVERLYERRCTGGTWDCITVPETGSGGGGDVNVGLSVATYTPYAEGEEFVARLYEQGGWDAVDHAFVDRPLSTEQLIDPDAYPMDRPAFVSVPDRSTDGWRPIETDGTPVFETAGEANVYAMFWYAEVLPRSHYTSDERGVNRYTYAHPYSDGWAGDRMAFYTDGDEGAYVWKLQWESAADAREFADAYRELLLVEGADERGDGVYVISDGGFADAFRLVRDGDTVLIVNGPTVGDLDAIHVVEERAAVATANRTGAA